MEHAIRTACQIIGHPAVIIVGSQAILGSFGEDELQVEATMSVEVDVLPIADSNTVIAELADLIEGVAGCRMRTPPLRRGGRSSSVGVWIPRICASRSCAPTGRRTSTSCVPSMRRGLVDATVMAQRLGQVDARHQ